LGGIKNTSLQGRSCH